MLISLCLRKFKSDWFEPKTSDHPIVLYCKLQPVNLALIETAIITTALALVSLVCFLFLYNPSSLAGVTYVVSFALFSIVYGLTSLITIYFLKKLQHISNQRLL